jgi:hypothetical protein
MAITAEHQSIITSELIGIDYAPATHFFDPPKVDRLYSSYTLCRNDGSFSTTVLPKTPGCFLFSNNEIKRFYVPSHQHN